MTVQNFGFKKDMLFPAIVQLYLHCHMILGKASLVKNVADKYRFVPFLFQSTFLPYILYDFSPHICVYEIGYVLGNIIHARHFEVQQNSHGANWIARCFLWLDKLRRQHVLKITLEWCLYVFKMRTWKVKIKDAIKICSSFTTNLYGK